MEMYPPIEPYDQGMIDVGDGNLVYWETCGNPDGKPGLVVHGGPGSGCSTGVRRAFDPDRYRVVLFDQRGCGRSTPTLILAYAERHPHRVSEIVIPSVTTTRRSEIDWLYRGVAHFFPEEWERFRAGVPEADRDDDLVAAYARLIQDPDPLVRAKATHDWCAWEDAVISLESHGKPNAYSDRPPADLLALVRICTHYFAHGAWLEEGALLRDADRLTGIPGVLIHGRHDLGGPLHTAWELARAWPDAELVTITDAGHTGSDTMRERIRSALDKFARQ